MFLVHTFLVACVLAVSTCVWPAAVSSPRPAPATTALLQSTDHGLPR